MTALITTTANKFVKQFSSTKNTINYYRYFPIIEKF